MRWTQARARLAAPVYAPIHAAIARLDPSRWPDLAALNALAEGLVTSRGLPLRFVPPHGPGDPERRYYEVRIAESGEVETRDGNWHDLFNALAWVAWPRAKAAINAQHGAILAERGPGEAKARSPERDALTLFDEGGLAVASSDPTLLAHIAGFEWKRLFWERRAGLEGRIGFYGFGHGCWEQSLAPYLGMVSKTVLLDVAPAFFARPLEAQVAALDERLAAHFADRRRFPSPRAMPPLPILGIPGWHFAAQDEAFYDDAAHFRSKGLRHRGI